MTLARSNGGTSGSLSASERRVGSGRASVPEQRRKAVRARQAVKCCLQGCTVTSLPGCWSTTLSPYLVMVG